MQNIPEHEEFFYSCLALAKTDRQVEIMWKTKSLYNEYCDDGVSVEEAMEKEWG